jgi:hypothetical protein
VQSKGTVTEKELNSTYQDIDVEIDSLMKDLDAMDEIDPDAFNLPAGE